MFRGLHTLSLLLLPLLLLPGSQGNTEVGIETRFKGAHYGTQVAVSHVPELNAWTVGVDGQSGRAGVFIGAAMSLSEIDARIETVLASHGMWSADCFICVCVRVCAVVEECCLRWLYFIHLYF